jgi:hypothetical protein
VHNRFLSGDSAIASHGLLSPLYRRSMVWCVVGYVRIPIDPIPQRCEVFAYVGVSGCGRPHNPVQSSPQGLFGLGISAYNTVLHRMPCSCKCLQSNRPGHGCLECAFCKSLARITLIRSLHPARWDTSHPCFWRSYILFRSPAYSSRAPTMLPRKSRCCFPSRS